MSGGVAEVVLVTLVPESTKPALKMLYATAKASLMERLSAAGVKPTNSVRVHTHTHAALATPAAHAVPHVRVQIQSTTVAEVSSELGSDASLGVGKAPPEFSKPSRPGRGRARIIRGGV